MPQSNKKLKVYRARRDLKKSPEPYGGKIKKHKKPLFVVQKHEASHLHYDFRLEIDGVLVSWAVPKGFTYDPSIKRLAMQTDDHPLEYGDFEGTIPPGNYGAGTVMIWDTGTFSNLKDISLSKALAKGHLEVCLEGKKLHGGFALVKLARAAKNAWLLIKMNDEYAHHGTQKKFNERSAKTGKTMRQIAQGESVWQSNRKSRSLS